MAYRLYMKYFNNMKISTMLFERLQLHNSEFAFLFYLFKYGS